MKNYLFKYPIRTLRHSGIDCRFAHEVIICVMRVIIYFANKMKLIYEQYLQNPFDVSLRFLPEKSQILKMCEPQMFAISVCKNLSKETYPIVSPVNFLIFFAGIRASMTFELFSLYCH
jgi:hypothetical protein